MYRFGNHSQSQLVGLHPEIGFMFSEAIKITKQDFQLFEGVRTLRRQRYLYSTGASKTMNSYHLYGLAGDAVPWVNGALSWEEEYFPPVEKAIKTIIKAHGLHVKWGFDLWKWDMAHWQMLPVYRGRWDVRKLNPNLECK